MQLLGMQPEAEPKFPDTDFTAASPGPALTVSGVLS